VYAAVFTISSSVRIYNSPGVINGQDDNDMTSGERMISTEAVERGAGVAVWLQIEQILSAEIAEHGFGEEGRLPSETELAKRFDVNRHTVRRAMMRLASTGLICVEPGRGTFVQPGAIDYKIGRRTRFTENLRRQNHSPSGVILSSEKVRAEPLISKALSIRTGAYVFEIESRHESDGVPLTRARSWYPAARFAGLPEVLAGASSISEGLAKYGVTDYTRKWSRICSVLPSSELARELQINRQQPVLRIENLDVDGAGVPIKYGVTHFAADRVQLLVEDEP
jgi:GntR family transcriptional regulator, phosphonate transport system regulatory protein